jgi:hypothetical protein
MKLVNVINAEWNPDNQIILKIADADVQNVNEAGVYPSISSTKRTIVFNGITESEATATTVCNRLNSEGMQPTRTKFNIN